MIRHKIKSIPPQGFNETWQTWSEESRGHTVCLTVSVCGYVKTNTQIIAVNSPIKNSILKAYFLYHLHALVSLQATCLVKKHKRRAGSAEWMRLFMFLKTAGAARLNAKISLGFLILLWLFFVVHLSIVFSLNLDFYWYRPLTSV